MPDQKIQAGTILYLGRPRSLGQSIDKDGHLSIQEITAEEVVYLRRKGFDVDVTRTASDAYGSLRLNHYDAFLLTPESPAGTLKKDNGHRLSGQTLLRLMEDENIGVPTIVLTTIIDPELKTDISKRRDVIATFEKPYYLDRLMSYIELTD